jgi:ribosomal protein L11 methyltransferase
VADILARAAPGTVAVEPAHLAVDDGLEARVDPSRPAVVRAYVVLAGPGDGRRAVTAVEQRLWHLRAFGLGRIGPLRTRALTGPRRAEGWSVPPPVQRIGRSLVIRPSRRRHRRRPGDVILALDPGRAFGTGLHPTTRLCLRRLEAWADEGRVSGARVLDLGSGSGILAVAAARLGAARVLALDTDELAVQAAISNARRNRVARRVRVRQGSVPSGEPPFDLVLANLVAGLLVELAPRLADELAPTGRLVVSGIVAARGRQVTTALASAGLAAAGREHDEGWVAIEARPTPIR